MTLLQRRRSPARTRWADVARRLALGSFTLFDLASQRLSRDTTLPLEESTFHLLACGAERVVRRRAVAAAARFAPAMVQGSIGAAEPRGADDLHDGGGDRFDCDAGTRERGKFEVPARVPVERVSFVAGAGIQRELQPRGEGERDWRSRVSRRRRARAAAGDGDGKHSARSCE